MAFRHALRCVNRATGLNWISDRRRAFRREFTEQRRPLSRHGSRLVQVPSRRLPIDHTHMRRVCRWPPVPGTRAARAEQLGDGDPSSRVGHRDVQGGSRSRGRHPRGYGRVGRSRREPDLDQRLGRQPRSYSHGIRGLGQLRWFEPNRLACRWRIRLLASPLLQRFSVPHYGGGITSRCCGRVRVASTFGTLPPSPGASRWPPQSVVRYPAPRRRCTLDRCVLGSRNSRARGHSLRVRDTLLQGCPVRPAEDGRPGADREVHRLASAFSDHRPSTSSMGVRSPSTVAFGGSRTRPSGPGTQRRGFNHR